MPHAIVATSWSQIEGLRGLWESLYSSERHTLFQTYDWNLLAAKAFSDRESPFVVAVEHDAGAAIVPACVAPHSVRLLGEELFDYRDFLAKGDEDVASTAWAKLAELSSPLHVTALRQGPSWERWQSLGFTPTPFVTAPCILRGGQDAEKFESIHHRGARLVRKLARAGVTFHEYAGTNAALVRSIYESKATQILEGSPNLLADNARREFLVAACALGSSDIFTLETAGTLVAALVTFRDAKVRRFYTIYYDRAWAHFSPGVALLYEVTRRSLAQGLDCDYMTGEQPHKRRFATSSVPLFRVNASAAQLAEIAAGTKLVAA